MLAASIQRLFRTTSPVRTKTARKLKSFAMDVLEDRTVPALVGLIPQLPVITYNSTGHIEYNAAAHTFDFTATPLVFKESAASAPQNITGVRDFAIHLSIDNSGNLIGGVPGDDFVVKGDLDVDGDGTVDASGVLLTGEISQFGWQDVGTTDLYDFRFTTTGGLLASYFPGKDVAIRTSSEHSTFEGNFGVDFNGGAKGNVGTVDQLPKVSSISGFVYYDFDNDGVFDNTESAIPGTTVSLTGTDVDGASVSQSTTTDSNGYYIFSGLKAGTYTLTETQPAGYADGKDTIGTPGGSTGNDVFSNIVLPSGFDGINNNFGEVKVSSISGFVYYDFDNDGVFDNTESAIGGATVALTGTDVNGSLVSQSTTTDSNGYYIFSGLLAGNYTLTETQPAGYADGKDSIGTPGGSTANDVFSNIVLPFGYDGVNNNFGEIKVSSISGFVYYDLNNNGVFNNTEAPIANTTIKLTGVNADGAAVSLTTATDANGYYIFSGLRGGTYTLTETQPAGYADGKDTIGTPGGSTANDVFSNIVLPFGYDGVNNNFGEIKVSSISGFVYYDLNNNGVFNTTESPIANTTIKLTGVNADGAAVSLTTTTDANGFYIFSGLRGGTYTLTETQPAGYADGKDTIGTPGGSTANDVFSNIVLPFGYNGVNNNFGELKYGSITGTKFRDVTGNGQSCDDVGLAGTTIYIDADNDGALDAGETKTVTAADGSYSFNNLAPGTYTIREVVGTNFIRTGPTLSDNYKVAIGYNQVSTGNNFANFQMDECHCSISGIYYVVNGCKVVTDLRGNTDEGDRVQAVFTVAPGSENVHLTLVSYTAPGSTFNANNANQQQIFDIASGYFSAGTHSLEVVIPDAYYQVDFVCGDAIDTFGPAGSNVFYSAQGRLLSADNDGSHAVTKTPSSLSGVVFVDGNNNGKQDTGEKGIAGASLKLTGTNDLGQSISRTITTDANGRYTFSVLRAGTYTVTELQPVGYKDGKDALGDHGGSLSNDKITSIKLNNNDDAYSYNFGESYSSSAFVGSGDAAVASYWNGTKGQALIKALNGSSSSTKLGNWLAGTLSNLFGSGAGSANDLTGKSNTAVASYFKSLYGNSGKAAEAEVLATALSVYVTDSDLAGTTAVAYGFLVDSTGLGGAAMSVGDSGAAFGLANYTTITVKDALAAANSRASNGALNTNNTLKALAKGFFYDVNQLGGVA